MPPKRIFKDEAHDDERRAKQRADAIATVEAVLGKIISKPSVLDAPDLDNIKSMVCRIGRDWENFPSLYSKNCSKKDKYLLLKNYKLIMIFPNK